ncbi:MAG: hypothetical protein ACPGLV_03620 [Bacteroidia bacterium]
MQLNLITLIAYTIISISAAIVLGQNLYKNGEPFLQLMLPKHWVQPVNNILLAGFYLVNIAFVLLYLSVNNSQINNPTDALGFIITKVGTVFTILGFWHYCNIAIILIISRKIKNKISWTLNS